MPRYAKRSPDGVTLFCDALSPMKLSRRDDDVEFPVKVMMPLFEKLADLEEADGAGGTDAIVAERDRFRALVVDVARANLLRYKEREKLVMRVYKQDYANLADRFALKRKKGLCDEDAWDAVIGGYIGSPDFDKVRHPDG